MKFHVPFTEDEEQAEAIWSGLRERLLDVGVPTTRRRIRALSLDDRRPGWRLEVGDGTPDTGALVLVILESRERGLYYIFTPDHGVVRGQPYPPRPPRTRQRHRLRAEPHRAALGQVSALSRA